MHSIQPHKDPYYSNVEGLELVIDGQIQAVIKTKGSDTNFIFAFHGPKDLNTARTIVIGLLDLQMHFDAMAHKRGKT